MKLTKCVASIPEYNKLTEQYSSSGWLIKFPYDNEFLDEFKDAIDRPYREWNPATKTWWVSEDCGPVLMELFENWSFPIAPPRKQLTKVIRCQKCHDTGLLSFVKKDGLISKYAKVFCECHQEDQHEHLYPLKQRDFDFPMSYDFRSFVEEMATGRPLPSINLPEIPLPLVGGDEPKWSGKQWDKVQQLQSEVEGWRKKHAEVLLALDKLTPKKGDGF